MNWLLLTAAVLAAGIVAALLLRRRFPVIGTVLLAVLALAAAVIVTGTAICWQAPADEDRMPDYGVLLGCALQNGQPTPELVRRCRMALIWLQDNPDQILIVSGGDPAGQGVTEAAVMTQWLTEHGADMERIVSEPQAKDTRQNLQFSKTLAQSLDLETNTVLIITSEYHQTRAQYLAEMQGQQAVGISCRTPYGDRLQASVREVYAFAKVFLENRDG